MLNRILIVTLCAVAAAAVIAATPAAMPGGSGLPVYVSTELSGWRPNGKQPLPTNSTPNEAPDKAPQEATDSPNIWTVDPNGEINTITQALVLASSGDTIYVEPGDYSEPVIKIEKTITLIGREGARIVGGNGHELVAVLADGVTITGLEFRGVERSFMEDRSAIRIEEAHDCRIRDNVFRDNFFAVYMAKSSGCIVEGNDIEGAGTRETESGNGIHLWYSRNVTVRNNRIYGHRDGIYFEFVEDSEVIDNVSRNNLRYGLHFMFSDRCHYSHNEFRSNRSGVAIMYSEHVEIMNNLFIRNWGQATFGLLMKEIDDSKLIGNRFEQNSIALFIEGSNRMLIESNTFASNGWAMKIMANSEDNVVQRNNFLHNTFDVTTNSRRAVSLFVNNYWDTYKGYDLNHDGYGDLPHRPVRFFSIVVEQYEPALALLNSLFVGVLDAAENMLPVLTPTMFTDEAPSIKPWSTPDERPAGARVINAVTTAQGYQYDQQPSTSYSLQEMSC
jgi:nitrous oxidase accessory protein